MLRRADAAACGSEQEHDDITRARPRHRASTPARDQLDAHEPDAQHPYQRDTPPAPAHTHTADRRPSPLAAVPAAPWAHYAGHGNKAIGTIALKSPVRLTWSAAKPKIQVFTSTGFVLVNSRKSSGSVLISKGTYRGVRVASGGAGRSRCDASAEP